MEILKSFTRSARWSAWSVGVLSSGLVKIPSERWSHTVSVLPHHSPIRGGGCWVCYMMMCDSLTVFYPLSLSLRGFTEQAVTLPVLRQLLNIQNIPGHHRPPATTHHSYDRENNNLIIFHFHNNHFGFIRLYGIEVKINKIK